MINLQRGTRDSLSGDVRSLVPSLLFIACPRRHAPDRLPRTRSGAAVFSGMPTPLLSKGYAGRNVLRNKTLQTRKLAGSAPLSGKRDPAACHFDRPPGNGYEVPGSLAVSVSRVSGSTFVFKPLMSQSQHSQGKRPAHRLGGASESIWRGSPQCPGREGSRSALVTLVALGKLCVSG